MGRLGGIGEGRREGEREGRRVRLVEREGGRRLVGKREREEGKKQG